MQPYQINDYCRQKYSTRRYWRAKFDHRPAAVKNAPRIYIYILSSNRSCILTTTIAYSNATTWYTSYSQNRQDQCTKNISYGWIWSLWKVDCWLPSISQILNTAFSLLWSTRRATDRSKTVAFKLIIPISYPYLLLPQLDWFESGKYCSTLINFRTYGCLP